jgi:hypothetical protein
VANLKYGNLMADKEKGGKKCFSVNIRVLPKAPPTTKLMQERNMQLSVTLVR